MTPVPSSTQPSGPRPPLGRQHAPTAAPPTASGPEPTGAVSTHRPRRTTRLLVAAVAVLAVLLTAVIAFRWGAADSVDAAPTTAAATTTEESSSTSLAPAAVYRQILPSFVAVRTEAGIVGAGVVVTGDGLVLTALSAVTDASGAAAAGIRLSFADGTNAIATVAGVDDRIGIAVLEPSAFPEVIVPAVLGAPGAIGDPVTVVGNPLDLTASLTAGVVSGLDRTATSPIGTELSGLVQFDAAVGAGSVGGPLLNERAEVIGVVVSSMAGSSGGDSSVSALGFAVPIAVAVTAGGADLPR